MSEDIIEDPKLSKVEENQAFKPQRTISKGLSQAVSERVLLEPSLYKEVSPNPYSPQALQLMSEELPTVPSEFFARAIILAEPEGAYDKVFHEATLAQKREMLYDQIDSSAEMSVRLSNYLTEHTNELWDLSYEQLFENLTEAAFDTTDDKKIKETYAQNQRRGFRLAIVNFIEDLPVLKQYKEKFDNDPLTTAGEILNQTFDKEIKIEVLPIGIVIELDEKDYEKIPDGRHMPGHRHIGTVIKSDTVPLDLRGKVILLNRGGDDQGLINREDLQNTKEHEIKHVIYENYFHEGMPMESKDEGDNRKIAQYVEKKVLLLAKDESIAYVANHNLHPGLIKVGANYWDGFLVDTAHDLKENDALSIEEKSNIYTLYQNQMKLTVDKIRTFQWVQRKLIEAANEGRDGLTSEKAEALLRLTPIDQVGRLSKYIGLTPAEVPIEEHREEQSLQVSFTQKLSEIVTSHDSHNSDPLSHSDQWEKEEEDIYDFVSAYPKAAMHSLLEVIPVTDNIYFQMYFTRLLKGIVDEEGRILEKEELNAIKVTLQNKYAQPSEGAREIVEEIAKEVLQSIDTQSVDFAHNPPE